MVFYRSNEIKKGINNMEKRSASVSRQLILNAAGEVFSEKGYVKTTMRSVAQKAGISIGGIYLYYNGKDQLYSDILKKNSQSFLKKLEALPNEDSLTALEQFFSIQLDHISKEAKRISIIMKEYDLPLNRAAREEFKILRHQVLMKILKKGVATGLLKDMSYEKTADVIIYCLRGLVHSYFSDEVRDVKRQGRIILEFILNAIKKE